MKIIEGSSARVFQFNALADNYFFVIQKGNEVLIIDPTVPGIFPNEAKRRDWTPKAILNTHHHFDHVGGNFEIQTHWPIETYGSFYDKDKGRIPGLTKTCQGGDAFSLMGLEIKVIDVKAHTLGHIAYWLPDENWVFVGDSLFSLGCGRLFEGQPTDLFTSLQNLTKLPDPTKIFCAHEYTLSNFEFHKATFSEDPYLEEIEQHIRRKIEIEGSTVPSQIGFEKKFNPFLRWSDPALNSKLNTKSETEYLAVLRKLKDHF